MFYPGSVIKYIKNPNLLELFSYAAFKQSKGVRWKAISYFITSGSDIVFPLYAYIFNIKVVFRFNIRTIYFIHLYVEGKFFLGYNICSDSLVFIPAHHGNNYLTFIIGSRNIQVRHIALVGRIGSG